MKAYSRSPMRCHPFHHGDRRVLKRLSEMEQTIMGTLQDILDTETAEGGEITQLVDAFNTQSALIDDLRAQIAALAPGTLTPDQQATIDAIIVKAQENQAAITAVLPAPAPTEPAPDQPPTDEPAPAPTFVAKLDGEDYTAYVNRVAAWNADPANAGPNVEFPITPADEATWNALPVS